MPVPKLEMREFNEKIQIIKHDESEQYEMSETRTQNKRTNKLPVIERRAKYKTGGR